MPDISVTLDHLTANCFAILFSAALCKTPLCHAKGACVYTAMLILQEFKAHDKSRESIEMALDEILKQKMKIRHKYGFKPPKSGRRTDVEGDPTVSQPFEDCLLCICVLCMQSH